MPRGVSIDNDWLREHYPRMTDINQLLDDHEREFGWRPNKTTLYTRANRLGLRKEPVANRDGRAERAVRWAKEPEMEAWMLEHDHGQRTDDLSRQFRERFGFALTHGQINLFRASHGTQNRRSNGGRPRAPLYSERASKDGYIVVKVREESRVPMAKDNWVLKHVWVYERTHGTVPEGHVVYFADGNNRNFDPDNLVAVPRRLVGVLSSLKAEGYGWHDADMLRTVMALAELRVARNDALASMPRTCPVCGRRFDNRTRKGTGCVSSTVCPECGKAHRKPPHEGRRRFDHDEIRRLHAAGYRNKEIAAMLGCTPTTVSNAVNYVSEKRKEERWRQLRAQAKEGEGQE